MFTTPVYTRPGRCTANAPAMHGKGEDAVLILAIVFAAKGDGVSAIIAAALTAFVVSLVVTFILVYWRGKRK